MKGRYDEAKVVLQRLHDDHPDPLFWEKEYIQVQRQEEQDRLEKSGVTWLEMFSTPSQRKRTLVSVMTMVMVQTTGAQTIQVFQSIFYGELGYSTSRTLLMSGVFQILLVAGASTSILIVDRFGRKPLLISGFVLVTCILACFIAFSAMFQNTGDPSNIHLLLALMSL